MEKKEQITDRKNVSAEITRLVLNKLYELNRMGKVPLERKAEYKKHVDNLKKQMTKIHV